MALLECSHVWLKVQEGGLLRLGDSHHDQLQEWQAKTLFIMDRVILVKSILSSMPVHLLSNTWIAKICLLKQNNLSAFSMGLLSEGLRVGERWGIQDPAPNNKEKVPYYQTYYEISTLP